MMPAKEASVFIGPGTVTKTGPRESMRCEVEKTRQAFAISERCGLFRVPKILDYDDGTGTAVFERLAIREASVAVPWGRDRTMLATQVGRSLAVIHRHLRLPDEMRAALPAPYAAPFGEVFLHGDVSLGNVCVGDSWPPIVIIDWQMTPLLGGRATYGTRYFDMLWFVGNLVLSPTARFVFGNPAGPAVRSFFQAYEEESGMPLERQELRQYAQQFFGEQTRLVKKTICETANGRLNRARLLWPFNLSVLRDVYDYLGLARVSRSRVHSSEGS